jgi:PAS domain S-box-containing protein
LEEGTQIIARGELDHRVDIESKDETGKLAKAFNEMTSRLKMSYASIDDLKRMEQDLRKSREELEIGVQERTAELAEANEELQSEIVKYTHAEETLREQSKILKGFFTSTVTPLVFLDRDFNFIRVNEAYAKACQRDVSEFPGHNHFEFYPSDAKAIFEQVVATKEPHQAIARPFTFPDHPEWGTTYWDWTLTPILDDEGEVEYLVFSLEDVTKAKQAELALRSASLYTRGLIEASIDPLVTISRDGKVMDVNKATELVTGKSREEIIGSDFSDYFTDPYKAREGYEQVFSQGLVKDYPLAIRHASGRVVEVLYNATVYKSGAGEVQGVFAAARDVTERNEVQKRIEATNALLSLFAKKSSRKEYLEKVVELICIWSNCRCVGVRILNEDGYVPYESYVGFSREFWESENWLSVRDVCACIRVITGKPDPQDISAMTPEGSFRCDNTFEFTGKLSGEEKSRFRGICVQTGFKSVAIIPIRYLEKIFGAIHLADEKERKVSMKMVEFIESMIPLIGEALNRFNLEEEIRDSESRLRLLSSELLNAQEKERKRIAGELHDSVVASLSAVKFSIESAVSNKMRNGTAEPELLEALISRVKDSIQETRRIMADLRPSVLDDLGILAALNWFCREYQETYSHIHIEKKIDIPEGEVPNSLKTVIFRISQEALNNIAKHSRAEFVEISLREIGRMIELAIQDNGQGFDLEKNLSESGSRKGLGLLSMRERAELSGGSFSIESIVGEGTRICVSWPL